AAEDHLAGSRLQDAGDDDVDRFADHLARVVDDHHRSVVEVGDALVVLLAFLEDEHLHQLAGQHHRLQRVGQLVDVEHVDAAQLRDLVQVEIVGDDLALERARELDQFQIDFADVGKVEIGDRDLDAGHLLDLLQDVETAAAAVALHRVGGIGDELQLLQDELRDDQRAVDEPGLADVGDAAVDDHARVEDLVAALRSGCSEQAREPRRLAPLAVLAAQDQPEIRKHDQREAMEKLHAVVAVVRPEQTGHDGVGDRKADRAADQGAEDARDRNVAEPALEVNDQRSQREGQEN